MQSPTILLDSGYASRLPSGDIEIQPQYRKPALNVFGGSTDRRVEDLERVTIPKSDAEKLARFILEGVE